MENGYSGANISTDSLLLARGVGGIGGFGSYNYGGQFADQSSNAVRINRNADLAAANTRCVDSKISANLDRISAQNFEGRFNAAITSLKDGQFQCELRNGDRLRDIEREMTANARVAADCCCDLKLQGCEDKAQILTAIAASNATALAIEGRGVERNLNAANSELTALKTQIACGCCPPSPCPS